MKKSDVRKFRIDIVSGNVSALSMLVCLDGTLSRQGNGSLPADEVCVQGESDGAAFNNLVDMLDDRIFFHTDVYDHPNKIGVPITYSIVFLGTGQNTAVFEFRFASETNDVGELLPFFDAFIARAVALTHDWYLQEKSKISSRTHG